MFAIERQQKIKELLKENSRVTIPELVLLFDTSHETIRKDLVYLEQQNALKRIYGGAVSIDSYFDLQSLAVRKTERVSQKAELCRYAAELLQENDIIAIDEGSTAMEFARVIATQFQHLTVLTHNLEVFRYLSENSNFSLFLCGGKYNKAENAVAGHFAVQMVSQLHTHKAFICPTAVSIKHGITDFGESFIPVQQAYANNTDKVIVLADSLKIESSSLYKIIDTTPEITIVTDSQLDEDIYRQYICQGLDIICGTEK